MGSANAPPPTPLGLPVDAPLGLPVGLLLGSPLGAPDGRPDPVGTAIPAAVRQSWICCRNAGSNPARDALDEADAEGLDPAADEFAEAPPQPATMPATASTTTPNRVAVPNDAFPILT